MPCLAPQVRHSSGLSHEQLTQLAAAEAAGCSGVTFLPYLAGERTPNWPHATGAVLGACGAAAAGCVRPRCGEPSTPTTQPLPPPAGLRPGLARPGLLYRAAMEGATFTLLAGMRQLQDFGLSPRCAAAVRCTRMLLLQGCHTAGGDGAAALPLAGSWW